MLLWFSQLLKVHAVTSYIDFFRTPEEGDLLFNQLLEDAVFLLIVTGHVNRVTEKHRFYERIDALLIKRCIFHNCNLARFITG